MNDIIKSIEAEQLKENVPVFNVGDTVKVYGKIKEGNRERIQVFEGTVLKKQGGSARATFTVRKFSNGVGVEKTWPLHSPNVEKVEVVRRGKVRRAKLYYLRDRVGKITGNRRGDKYICTCPCLFIYRKLRSLYHKKPPRDAHSREEEVCRRRPRSARECA